MPEVKGKIYEYSALTLSALLGIMIFAAIVGGYSRMTENSAIQKKCVKTDYVVIGNDGRAEVIYDCSGAKEVVETD